MADKDIEIKLTMNANIYNTKMEELSFWDMVYTSLDE